MAKIVLTNVRGRFMDIFVATSLEGNEPSYKGKFVIDPTDTANIKLCEEAEIAVAKEMWKGKADAVRSNFVRTGKKPDVFFVREPYKNKDGEPWDGFVDMFYVTASRKVKDGRPKVVDRNPKIELTEADGKPYDGCYVNVSMEVWAQDNKWGRAVRASLLAVQFVKDGDGFGGSPKSDGSEFGEVAVPESEDDFV